METEMSTNTTGAGGQPFVYNPELSDELLASFIVQHYQHGVDLKDNPLEEPLLFWSFKDGPERYMRVFAKAERMAEADRDTERQISFMLESWNGARRRPGQWGTSGVIHLKDFIPTLLDSLKNGERRTRLEELYWYHTGLTAHFLGRFTEAALAQDKVTEFARSRGDVQSVIICEAQAAYERACGELMNGDTTKDEKAITSALYCLRGHLSCLAELNDSSATNRRWKYGNGPVHRLLLHWLDERAYDAQEDDLDALHVFAASPEGSCFADWAFLLAWIRPKAFPPQDLRTDATIARCKQIVEKGGIDVELRALALHVQANLLMTLKIACVQAENQALDLCCSRGANKVLKVIEEAIRIYAEIIDLPDHGAVLLREYARRKFQVLQVQLHDTSNAIPLMVFTEPLKGPQSI